MRIGYVGGHWGSNLGNYYWNVGMGALLESLDHVDAYFLPDPAYFWSPRIQQRLCLVEQVEVDLVVFSGPVLAAPYLDSIAQTARVLRERSIEVGFISAGLGNYSADAIAATVSALTNLSPAFTVTRDSVTYEALVDRVRGPVYAGLCTSLFLPRATGGIAQMNPTEPYIVLNFQTLADCGVIEERIREGEFGDEIRRVASTARFVTSPTTMFPAPSSPMSGVLGAVVRRLGGKDRYERLATKWDFFTDNPYGNMILFSGAAAVFSDRVHTCAATMMTGGSACYVPLSRRANDGRSNLLADLGAAGITERPTRIDISHIERAQKRMRMVVSTALAAA